MAIIHEVPFEPAIVEPDPLSGPVQWFVFRKRELLVTAAGSLPTKEALDEHQLGPESSLYLGTLGDTHCFAARLSDSSTPPPGMTYRDLMSLFASIEPQIHQIAGRAAQLLDWERTHQLCGACGKPTEPSTTDRSRVCSGCGLAQFPRLAPAIIVTVERDDEILLARSPHFPPGLYSTLAGFVEPGESVEECVAREVREEVGVEVDQIRYFDSQPWPFPNSLMLGFTTTWKSGEIQIDGQEIVDAKWFHCDDMPTRFPGRISISQWLIDDFLRRRAGRC
ncbi:MAG: NAD(+) diphosphatase [Myxococcota bacterium]|nr:NAD(+) diphosphatase [Myxococcota bacterium]